MYIWAVFFHLIFVAFWMGGLLFTAAVLVPATRKKLASQKGLLFIELGTRFSRLSWAIFPLLLLTGFLALIGKGFPVKALASSEFWQSGYGSRLALKLMIFGIVLLISAAHDFWLGPKAAVLMDDKPDSRETRVYRKASSWIGRLNLLLGLWIIYIAVTLVR